MPPEAPSLTDLAGQNQEQTPEQKAAAEEAARAAAAHQEKPKVPEGFGESLKPYWNDDKGADFAKLSEDMQALTAFKAEQDSRAAQVPGTLEEYVVALPDDFQLPDGIDPKSVEVREGDPAIQIARELAKNLGLTKDQFKQMVAAKARMDLAEVELLKTRAGEEFTKLGTKGPQRVDAITKYFAATIGNEHANALLPMLFTAKQVEAFEKIMAVAKGGGLTLNGGGREAHTEQTEMTDEKWAAMSPTARIEYGRSHPETQRKAG